MPHPFQTPTQGSELDLVRTGHIYGTVLTPGSGSRLHFWYRPGADFTVFAYLWLAPVSEQGRLPESMTADSEGEVAVDRLVRSGSMIRICCWPGCYVSSLRENILTDAW